MSHEKISKNLKVSTPPQATLIDDLLKVQRSTFRKRKALDCGSDIIYGHPNLLLKQQNSNAHNEELATLGDAATKLLTIVIIIKLIKVFCGFYSIINKFSMPMLP
jgi:hypothetical protein